MHKQMCPNHFFTFILFAFYGSTAFCELLGLLTFFYWVEQIADLLWHNEKPGSPRTSLTFGMSDWHDSKLLDLLFVYSEGESV